MDVSKAFEMSSQSHVHPPTATKIVTVPAQAPFWSKNIICKTVVAVLVCVGLLVMVICLSVCVGTDKCSGDSNSNSNSMTKITITGLVTTTNGYPISHARLQVKEEEYVITDESGQFTLDTKTNGGVVILRVEAEDYAPQIATVPFQTSVPKYNTIIRMNSYTIVSVFDRAEGLSTTVSVFDADTTISIPPDPNASGFYTLKLAVISPEAGPGKLVSNDPGTVSKSTSLQSAGMFYFEIVNEKGEKATSSSSSQIPVTFAMADPSFVDSELHESDEMMWYSFDESRGVWKDPVPFTSKQSQSIATAVSLRFYNKDRNYSPACIEGTLVMSDGNVCAGALVETESFQGSYDAYYTGRDGVFLIQFPMGLQTALKANANFIGNVDFPMFTDTCKKVGKMRVPSDKICPNYKPTNPSPSPSPIVGGGGVSVTCSEHLDSLNLCIAKYEMNIWQYCGNVLTDACCELGNALVNECLMSIIGVCCGGDTGISCDLYEPSFEVLLQIWADCPGVSF